MLDADCTIDTPVHPIIGGRIEEERYTADGCQPWAEPEEIGCCPPPLCGNDLCCTFVAYMNLLPSGPLWDAPSIE